MTKCKKTAITLTCPVCGSTFLGNTKKKFCSEACRLKRLFERTKTNNETLHAKARQMRQEKRLKPEKILQAQNSLHKPRMQRQAEAKALGLSYGQYVALLGGELNHAGIGTPNSSSSTSN